MNSCHRVLRRTQGNSRRAPRGFTAIELMVVIAIVAILASLAAPSFSQMIERHRFAQSRDALTNTLMLARAEAIRRGGNVILAKSTSCGSGNPQDWSCGIDLFADSDGDKKYDKSQGDEMIFSTDLRGADLKKTSNASYMSITRWGDFAGVAHGFNLTLGSNSAVICISGGGRIDVQQKKCDSAA